MVNGEDPPRLSWLNSPICSPFLRSLKSEIALATWKIRNEWWILPSRAEMDDWLLQFLSSSSLDLQHFFPCLRSLPCHVRDFNQSLGSDRDKSLSADFSATANKTENMMLRPNNSSCKTGKPNESNFSWKIAPIILIGSSLSDGES